jgi:DNA modification methylase
MQERTGAGASRVKYELNHKSKSENYRDFEGREKVKMPKLRVPSTWQKFNTCTSKLHPTVKPLPLFEYMVKTYTNEGDTVLDNTMGSGTTMIACMNLNRNGIGIELDKKYFDVAQKRVNDNK